LLTKKRSARLNVGGEKGKPYAQARRQPDARALRGPMVRAADKPGPAVPGTQLGGTVGPRTRNFFEQTGPALSEKEGWRDPKFGGKQDCRTLARSTRWVRQEKRTVVGGRGEGKTSKRPVPIRNVGNSAGARRLWRDSPAGSGLE